jgi:peptide/nickel transport system substrate-binding protein
MSEPDDLNPLTSSSANASYIQRNLFSKLLEYNLKSKQLEPSLALQRPIIKVITEGEFKGGISLEYEIRPEATWDNDSPITGYDYLFTIKAIKFKEIRSGGLRPYYEFIKAIVVYKENPKKFIIYTKEPYFRAEEISGYQAFVLPEYHYDTALALRSVSITELDSEEKIKTPSLVAFANSFSEEKFSSDKDYIVGSGPYKVAAWKKGNNSGLRLERKSNWWGDQVKNCPYLKAYPTSIVYKVVPQLDEAIDLLKEGKLDIIRYMPPARFTELMEEKTSKASIAFHSVNQSAYHYIGLNTKLPKLSDLRVRKAIAHAVDRKALIKELLNGYASLANGPMSPHQPYFNKDIQAVDFNLKKSAQLLDEAGWKDKDKNGIREKIIKGKKVELEFSILYNQGHSIRKAILHSLRENLKEVGVNLIIEAEDFPTVLERVNVRNFESFVLAWVTYNGLYDFKQLWHSDSDIEYGSNRTGFQSPKCDQLIEELNKTFDPKKQEKLYKEIQSLIVKEQHYIFLFIPKELIVVRKGFEYPNFTEQRPGYVDRLFKKKAN